MCLTHKPALGQALDSTALAKSEGTRIQGLPRFHDGMGHPTIECQTLRQHLQYLVN